VIVYFGIESPISCSEVTGYERPVPADADPIRAAFEELLKGPSHEEETAGGQSWFSDSTAGMLRDVALVDDRLTVDFADFSAKIPNASSSCGSAFLLSQLTATAFQFDQVNHVAYSFEGSCEAFGEFLQMGCIEIARPE
jgi:spore germination protein GerM